MASAVATLIGDIVGSRQAPDRAEVHAIVTRALATVNHELDPVTALWITAGDEYQGAFASVGDAVRATLRLRLAMRPAVDVRHGIGWGAVSVLDEQKGVQDGPGWWSAREAIDRAEAGQRRATSRGTRTWYVPADGAGGTPPDPVNAALMLRDQLLHGLAEESLSVLAGMLAGMSQKEIADELGVSPSAVSQRVRRDGLAAVVRADDLLGRLP